MSKRISIIMPVYNKEDSVERAVDSILAQDYDDYEVIIVNDGSTDGSLSRLDKYKNSCIRIVSQANAGPGAARNTGLRFAKGELVAFLDADDEWLPNYLSESLRLLDASSRSTASITSGFFYYPKGNSSEPMWRKRGLRDQEFQLQPSHSPLHVVYLLAYMSSWSTIVKRSVIERWGGFYSEGHCTYGEDAFLWLKVLLNERVRFHLTPLVKYHRESSRLSANLTETRPIEPFLRHPEQIRRVCPMQLRGLLDKILAIRSLKTACVLGLSGKWKEAYSLKQSFVTDSFWQLPYFAPAMIASTPVGGLLGKIYRYTFSRENYA